MTGIAPIRRMRTCLNPLCARVFEDPGPGRRHAAQGYCSRTCASAVKRAARKPRKRRIASTLRADVIRAQNGLCICGCDKRATQAHHVLPRRRWPQLVNERWNVVGVNHDCHAGHENASRRLPWSVIPARCIEWAQQADDGALAFLERTYPSATRSQARRAA